MLPHFTNVVTANSLFEPIYKNLFEITVTIPALISGDLDSQQPIVLLENATNIKIDTTKNIAPVKQNFKYSTRTYATVPSKSIIDFDITFNMNQNEQKTVETWAILKRWYDLAWNSQTGELHYKRDMIGQVTANIHDRTGEVIRRVDFVNCQLQGLSGWDFNWANGGSIQNTTANFVADYWIDSYFEI